MPTKLLGVKLSPLLSLRVKFIVVIIFLFAVIFGILSFIVIQNLINVQKANLINQAEAFASLSTRPIGNTYNLYYNSGYLKFKEIIEDTHLLNKDVEKIQIISVSGELLFDSEEFKTGTKLDSVTDPLILDKVRENSTAYVYSSKNLDEVEEIIEPFFEDFGAHPFSVRYFISYDSINQTINNIRSTVLILTLLLLGLSVGLIVLVTNRLFLSPVKKVIDAAKAVSGGDLNREIVVKTGDEVEELATSVNHMAQTLRLNIEALKELDNLKDEFIMIASHNLRTPIITIQSYLSFFKKAKLQSNLRKYLSPIDDSLIELKSLTEELIGIVSLESKKDVLARQKTDIKKLLKDSAKSFSTLALEKKISLVFEFTSQDLPALNLDKYKIQLAANILIDNAIKFNKENGQVTIKVEKKDGNILVSIADTGIGIEKDKENLVFSKFFRGTSTLKYDYKGAGLGLYITKLIISAHGGKIWFESTPNKGTTFYFTLPIK